MLDRHLRTDEIDLLLDGEEGFGVAPLKAHVRECAHCQLELEQAREIVLALDALPDFAPSAGFSDRVMSQVQVFEPWHAAALTTARQFIPQSRNARIAAGLGAAVSAGALTSAAAWALSRADIALLLAQVGLERMQERVSVGLSDIATAALGQSALDAIRAGGPSLVAISIGGFVAAVGIAVVGLRVLATASQRRRG